MTLWKPFKSTLSSIVLKCLEKVISVRESWLYFETPSWKRNLVVFWNTLLEVGISFAALAPTMTSCSSPGRARVVTPIHPPIVPTEWLGRQNRVLFCLSTQGRRRRGVGARMGRVVASKRDPYYVWLAHISTIQECMQTANLRQNVNSWYLVTNANKFWNQSWEMWNKKSNP